jgi:hypothetical protein
VVAADVPAAPRQKDAPVRSEPYRRLVAKLPCIWCGIEGYSQAAHPPPSGKGIKESDLDCIPMCGPRPGEPGCHTALDQFKLMPRAQAVIWVRSIAYFVRKRIRRAGDWPARLAPYPGEEGDTQT